MRWALSLLFAAGTALPGLASAHIGLQPQTVDFQHPPGADLPIDLESLFAYFVSDDGETWRFTCHEALLADPSNPGTLLPRYVRAGDESLVVTMGTAGIGFVPDVGVYRSTDGGCDWEAVAGLDGRAVTDLLVLADGSTVLATTGDIAGDNGLYVSTDSGATFVASDTTGLDGYFVNVATGGGTTAWAAYADAGAGVAQLYRTDDSGATWAMVAFDELIEGSAPTDFAVLAVDPSDADHVHVVSAGQSFDYVHRTTDGGTGWEQVHQDASTLSDAAWDGGTITAAVASLRPVTGDGSAFTTAADYPFSEGLTLRSDGLLLATNTLLEDAAIMTPEGETLLSFEQVTEEISCPAGTRHAEVCSEIWPDASVVLSLFGPGDDDDAGDDDDTGPGDDDDGCGDCAADQSGPASPALLALLPLLLFLARRRA